MLTSDEHYARQKGWLEWEIERFTNKLKLAKSVSRRQRYGRKIRTLTAQLTYHRINNS